MIYLKKVFFVLVFLVCYCSSGAIFGQEINRFNTNNKRIGVWKKYHPNKRIRYTGQFENGKEIGVFKFYDITSSKHPVIIKTFYKIQTQYLLNFSRFKVKLKQRGF